MCKNNEELVFANWESGKRATHRFPLVHTQDSAIEQRSDNSITFPAVVPQQECEGFVPFRVIKV